MKSEVSSSTRVSAYADLLDVNAARRQLKLALSMTVVIAASVVSAALIFGAHPIDARRDVVSLPLMTTTLHAETNASGAVRS